MKVVMDESNIHTKCAAETRLAWYAHFAAGPIHI